MTDEKKEFQEYFTSFLEKNQAYFHGTSTIHHLKIGDKILPLQDTNTQRELYRTKNKDAVFITNFIELAKTWAYKAVQMFSGAPVVFLVEPDEYSLTHQMNAEYTADYAVIKGILTN